MGWRGRNRGRALFGLILALTMVAPASASATTGSIEGVTVKPSLAHASVQNLSVDYDGCSAVGNPTCSWEASAWLVAPPETSCPPNGSWLLMNEGHPPGTPGLGNRRIWRLESTGDGSVQSGPLQLNLEGVNDQHLCLYASDQPPPPPYTPGPPGSSELLASQLLHVDLPPGAGIPPAATVSPTVCKKHRVKRHGKCVKRRKHSRHRRHH